MTYCIALHVLCMYITDITLEKPALNPIFIGGGGGGVKKTHKKKENIFARRKKKAKKKRERKKERKEDEKTLAQMHSTVDVYVEFFPLSSLG